MSNLKRFPVGDLSTADLTRRVPRSGEYRRAAAPSEHASWHSVDRVLDLNEDEDGHTKTLELDRRVLRAPRQAFHRTAPDQGPLERNDRETGLREALYLLAIGFVALAVALAWMGA